MEVLRLVFAVFAVLGVVDKIFRNRFKLGREFDKGIMSAGSLILAMAGMLCLAPVIADGLSFVFSPLAKLLNLDLSFIGAFIANDMGGANVAKELASSDLIGGFNGLIVSSMMGVTLCFTIPVAMRVISRVYHSDVLLGILCGVATIPVGCIVSGLMLKIPFGMLLLNLSPVIFVTALTCIGLVFKPALCNKAFTVIGRVVSFIIIIGLAIGIFQYVSNITIIKNMLPLMDALIIVCDIAVILSGIFPLIVVVSRICRKPFAYIGRKMGIDQTSVLGLVSSLANSIPTFNMVEDMDQKGRIINMAFAVSASFVFGDHLAFTMAFNQKFLTAMVVGKLVSGISAVIVANIVCEFKTKPS